LFFFVEKLFFFIFFADFVRVRLRVQNIFCNFADAFGKTVCGRNVKLLKNVRI